MRFSAARLECVAAFAGLESPAHSRERHAAVEFAFCAAKAGCTAECVFIARMLASRRDATKVGRRFSAGDTRSTRTVP